MQGALVCANKTEAAINCLARVTEASTGKADNFLSACELYERIRDERSQCLCRAPVPSRQTPLDVPQARFPSEYKRRPGLCSQEAAATTRVELRRFLRSRQSSNPHDSRFCGSTSRTSSKVRRLRQLKRLRPCREAVHPKPRRP